MANKMTRAEALTNVIVFLRENEQFGDDWSEEIEVLDKMLTSINKQKTRPKTPSKTRLENERLADNLVGEMVAVDKPVNTKWITEHVKFITNSQKANVIVKIAIEKGDIIRFEDDKKKVWYKLAE